MTFFWGEGAEVVQSDRDRPRRWRYRGRIVRPGGVAGYVSGEGKRRRLRLSLIGVESHAGCVHRRVVGVREWNQGGAERFVRLAPSATLNATEPFGARRPAARLD